MLVPPWSSAKAPPEEEYKGSESVYGKIAEYRGVPEVIADAPVQISIEAN
jgi:hypothetical protein